MLHVETIREHRRLGQKLDGAGRQKPLVQRMLKMLVAIELQLMPYRGQLTHFSADAC
jgi:hypothetical protein